MQFTAKESASLALQISSWSFVEIQKFWIPKSKITKLKNLVFIAKIEIMEI